MGATKPKDQKNRPPAILVRFTNSTKAEAWLAKRNTGLTSHNIIGKEGSLTSKIFINENLTLTNRELHWNARVCAKKLNFKYVWVKNGRIYMRKEENSTVIPIKKLEDLPKMTDTSKKV